MAALLRRAPGAFAALSRLPAVSAAPLARFQATAASTEVAPKADGIAHHKLKEATSIALAGIVPAAIFAPCAALDYSLALVLPIHTTIGLDMIITDYVHIPPVTKLLQVGNYLFGVAAFGGLMFVNLYDVGITGAVALVWTI